MGHPARTRCLTIPAPQSRGRRLSGYLRPPRRRPPSATHSGRLGYRRRATERPEQRPDAERLIANRYRLGEIIGRGGMATIDRAHDTRLGRDVALKLLRPEISADRDLADRFAGGAGRHCPAPPEHRRVRGHGLGPGRPVPGHGPHRGRGPRRPPGRGPTRSGRARWRGSGSTSRGPWASPTSAASSIATSSRATSCWPATAARSSPTSASPAWPRMPRRRCRDDPRFGPVLQPGAGPGPEHDRRLRRLRPGAGHVRGPDRATAVGGETPGRIALARVGATAPSPRDVRPDVPLALDGVVTGPRGRPVGALPQWNGHGDGDRAARQRRRSSEPDDRGRPARLAVDKSRARAGTAAVRRRSARPPSGRGIGRRLTIGIAILAGAVVALAALPALGDGGGQAGASPKPVDFAAAVEEPTRSRRRNPQRNPRRSRPRRRS